MCNYHLWVGSESIFLEMLLHKCRSNWVAELITLILSRFFSSSSYSVSVAPFFAPLYFLVTSIHSCDFIYHSSAIGLLVCLSVTLSLYLLPSTTFLMYTDIFSWIPQWHFRMNLTKSELLTSFHPHFFCNGKCIFINPFNAENCWWS